MNKAIDFQKILDQFNGDLVFKRLVTTNQLSPDEYLYRIETNDGHYYIYEVDFIDTFADITNGITSKIGEYKYFVEAKHPPEKFEDTGPFKSASIYPTPEDFDELKKYANDKYGSHKNYFNFLIKI